MKELIRKYLGVPYKKNKDDTIGMECFDLVKVLYEEGLGLHLSSHAPDNMSLFYEYWCKDYGWEFPWEKIKQWDLLLIHSLFSMVDHVGIAVDKESFVHANEASGVCVDRILRHKHRIYQIARLRQFGEEYTDQEKSVILRPATYECGGKFYAK